MNNTTNNPETKKVVQNLNETQTRRKFRAELFENCDEFL